MPLAALDDAEPRPDDSQAVPVIANRPRRTTALVALVLLVVVGGPVAAFYYLTYIPDTSKPRTVADTHEIVSVDLPAGWFDDTRDDAGEISTEGRSDVTQAYRVPDIEASRDFLDVDPTDRSASNFDVVIGIPAHRTPHRTQHQMQVREAVEDPAAAPSSTTTTQISGFPAITTTTSVEASSGEPAGVVLLMTVLTNEYLVTIRSYTNLPDDPAGQELGRLIMQARISDERK